MGAVGVDGGDCGRLARFAGPPGNATGGRIVGDSGFAARFDGRVAGTTSAASASRAPATDTSARRRRGTRSADAGSGAATTDGPSAAGAAFAEERGFVRFGDGASAATGGVRALDLFCAEEEDSVGGVEDPDRFSNGSAVTAGADAVRVFLGALGSETAGEAGDRDFFSDGASEVAGTAGERVAFFDEASETGGDDGDLTRFGVGAGCSATGAT